MAAAHSTRDRVRSRAFGINNGFLLVASLSFIDRLLAILERYLEERKEVIKEFGYV